MCDEVYQIVNNKLPGEGRSCDDLPMKFAVEAGQHDLVKLLLRSGTDLRVKPKVDPTKVNLNRETEAPHGSNDTLMELAARMGHFEITCAELNLDLTTSGMSHTCYCC